MSGKLDVGAPVNNIGAARIHESSSFCDGIAFRQGGTLVGRPFADNPHPITSPDGLAWARGWIVADDASPGALDPLLSPACAVTGLSVVDV